MDKKIKSAHSSKSSPKIASAYNNRWSRIRRLVIQDQPICQCCIYRGKITPTEEIDHIIPFNIELGNEDPLFFEYDNLMGLCKECHRELTIHQHKIGLSVELGFDKCKLIKIKSYRNKISEDGFY